jgi:2-methylisocitrate lyase-like PEP mutase family enzyme
MVERFRALHEQGLLLMPNAWDVGSAMLLAALGFDALATTSSGFAATLGRRDYGVTRDEALAHAAALAAAVDVPVSADLEDGWDDPAETARGAIAAGLAGCSIEDYSRGEAIAADEAAARVRAMVEAADGRLVVTARCEHFLYERADLDDTIARLGAYAEAGADVLYAPGLRTAADIRAVVEAVGRPVNVLALPDVPPVAELAAIGVRRVSVGGAFAFAALGAAVEAANELRETGTYGFWAHAKTGSAAARRAFSR